MAEDTTIEQTPVPPRGPIEMLSDIAIGIAAAALFGLVLVQGWQVIARYVLNDSPSWTEPVTLLLLSTAMSLGAASGVHTQRHFGFFLLADAAAPSVRRILAALTPLIIIAIGAVIAFWASRLLMDGIDIRVAGARMPQSINYLPLAIGGALMVVFAINQLWMALTAGASVDQGDR